jgi:hypothetical protein
MQLEPFPHLHQAHHISRSITRPSGPIGGGKANAENVGREARREVRIPLGYQRLINLFDKNITEPSQKQFHGIYFHGYGV